VNAVVAPELAQRFPGRPTAKQVDVCLQSARSAVRRPLHNSDFASVA
jgi:hypothetical protein